MKTLRPVSFTFHQLTKQLPRNVSRMFIDFFRLYRVQTLFFCLETKTDRSTIRDPIARRVLKRASKEHIPFGERSRANCERNSENPRTFFGNRSRTFVLRDVSISGCVGRSDSIIKRFPIRLIPTARRQ